MESNSRSRIRIAVGDCSIEIEGSENYVEKKLEDSGGINELIMSLGKNVPKVAENNASKKKHDVIEPEQKTEKEKRKRVSAKGAESYRILPDLDLSAKDDKPSLIDFFKEKNPKSAIGMNPVFVYYLKKYMNIDKIGLDHVYTCYKDVKAKVPARLYQSLIDTRNRKGAVITDSMDDIRIGTVGENFVETELPRQKKSKK